MDNKGFSDEAKKQKYLTNAEFSFPLAKLPQCIGEIEYGFSLVQHKHKTLWMEKHDNLKPSGYKLHSNKYLPRNGDVCTLASIGIYTATHFTTW